MRELSDFRVLSHVLGDCYGDPTVPADADQDGVWRAVLACDETHQQTVSAYRSATDDAERISALEPLLAMHVDGEPSPHFGALWGYDAALATALEAASLAPDRDVCGQLYELLPAHLRGDDVWRLFAEEKDWEHLGRFYTSAAVALTRHDVVAARQYDLIGMVYTLAGRLGHEAGRVFGRKVVSVWRAGDLPHGIRDPHPPITEVHAAHLVGPWVRRTQLDDWCGNRDGIPEVAALRKAKAPSVGAILAGMCQVLGRPERFALPFPARLTEAVLDLVPTLFGSRRSFLFTLEEQRSVAEQPALPAAVEKAIAQTTRRTHRSAGSALPELVARVEQPGATRAPKKSHVVRGLSAGGLLWPLVEAMQTRGVVSWRSDVPEVVALLKVKPSDRGHVLAGMTQLTLCCTELGLAPEVGGAAGSVFGSLMSKKGRSYTKAVFDEEDVAHLAVALAGDPPMADWMLSKLIAALTTTREQGVEVDPSLRPYRPYPLGWSWNHAITLRRKRLAEGGS